MLNFNRINSGRQKHGQTMKYYRSTKLHMGPREFALAIKAFMEFIGLLMWGFITALTMNRR